MFEEEKIFVDEKIFEDEIINDDFYLKSFINNDLILSSSNNSFIDNNKENILLNLNEKEKNNSSFILLDTKSQSVNKENKKIFYINKEKKIIDKLKEKKERFKNLLKKKTNRNLEENKNYVIIDDKIIKKTENLSKKEKEEIRKIKNRISAQKSRDEQKFILYSLKRENDYFKNKIKNLTDEIIKKDEIINNLSSNLCENCKKKLIINNNNKYIIEDNNNKINNNNNNFINSKLSISLLTIFCILICIFYNININFNYKIRNLKEKYFSNYFYYNSNNFNLQNEKNICDKFMQAKISKELYFDNLKKFEENKCYEFNIIIPKKINNNFQPALLKKNSEIYHTFINDFNQTEFYEINCKINSINQYKNSKCKNNFLN